MIEILLQFYMKSLQDLTVFHLKNVSKWNMRCLLYIKSQVLRRKRIEKTDSPFLTIQTLRFIQ